MKIFKNFMSFYSALAGNPAEISDSIPQWSEPRSILKNPLLPQSVFQL